MRRTESHYFCDRCGAGDQDAVIRKARVSFFNRQTRQHDMGRTAGDFCPRCINQLWPAKHKDNRDGEA